MNSHLSDENPISELLLDKADQEFFKVLRHHHADKTPAYLLDQYRSIRISKGRQTEGDYPPLTNIPDPIPATFLEFLSEHSEHNGKQLLVLGARESNRPLVEPDTLPTTPTPSFHIEGLPIALLNKTSFGTATLLHCCPYLDKVLETETLGEEEDVKDDKKLPTAADLLRKHLGVIKLHYLLCSPAELQRYQDKLKGNAKLIPLTYQEIDEAPPADLAPALSVLETVGIMRKRTPEEKANEISKYNVEEILQEIRKNRVKDGHPARTEWLALTGEYPFLSLENTPIQEKIITNFPGQLQKKYNCFPINLEGNILTMAVFEIPTVQTRTEITNSLPIRCKIQFVLANKTQVLSLITKSLSAKVNLRSIAEKIQHDSPVEDLNNETINIEELVRNVKGVDDEKTIIQLLQGLIVQAVQDKATDIHVASNPDRLRISFRIDGHLQPYPFNLPSGLAKPLITRIKIVSNINTQKTGMPEDGKHSTTIAGLEYEIRVTTCPTVHGEKAVLRIQPKASHIPTLESLGYQSIEKQIILKAIESDHGLLILCGPTGSGKSTTLYAAIGLIDRVKWNVITAEQPVEIKIPDTEQTPITGPLTFGKFVSASLRQDPDYIMIGETRDKETTEEVIRAAITGHIVLTTLHTNSAPSAPSRLIDLGGKPYLLADALTGVCAQRLVRRLCTNCMQKTPLPTLKKIKEMGIREEWLGGKEFIYQPIGCKMCRETGYAGRIAVIEGYTINREIRDIIQNRDANPKAIQAIMEAQGSKSLFQHAIENVSKGICSLNDALSIQTID